MKVFNIEGYDGSVQVPKPSVVLIHATRTMVTPSFETCDRTQTSVALLERQTKLAVRREGGNAAGFAMSTTGGARRNWIVRGGCLLCSKITMNSINDGHGDFTSVFGGITDDDVVVGPAG